MLVIAELVGVPAADWPRYRRWSDVILKLANTISRDEEAARTVSEYRAVTAEMRAFLPDLIAQRRAAHQDDLLTRLVEAEVDGDRLTQEEVLGFVQLLLVGGQETTANLINNTLLCFIESPDQFARLQAAPELLPSAIEEVLRYRSPVQWMPRATRRDVEMHGRVIPAGKLVLPMIGSANRDTQQFPDAGRFDIARDPNPHIAFGHGIHSCLGAPLARRGHAGRPGSPSPISWSGLIGLSLRAMSHGSRARRWACTGRRGCRSASRRVGARQPRPDAGVF
jgi:cytochrome P450